MTTLNAIIKELRTAQTRMVSYAQSGLNSVIPSLIRDFKSRSPVDSGQYKQSWKQAEVRFSDTNVVASKKILNDDPKAPLMEFGAEPETAPWYFPNAKTPTGKLKEHDGRIWAGGLKPGHSLTVGGAITPVLFGNNERQLKIANVIADRVLKAI